MTAKPGLSRRGGIPAPAIPSEPFASSEAVRARMSAQRRRDTGPELALRRELHAMGLRYFVHRRPLPALNRQADILFPRAMVAVFVDGCHWHGCPEHGPKRHLTNGWYWSEKIASNVRRDRDTDERLASSGWRVVRVWEHKDPAEAAETIASAVRATSGR